MLTAGRLAGRYYLSGINPETLKMYFLFIEHEESNKQKEALLLLYYRICLNHFQYF